MGAALRNAENDRTAAAATLRKQARESLKGAAEALANDAGDERALQLIERAQRRIRAAGAVEAGLSTMHPKTPRGSA